MSINIPVKVNGIDGGKEPEFADSSGPLFFMYRKMAEEEDDKMAKRWQKDAQGILIFTGLFSAAVAALLAVTVLDLKQTSQDRSAFYLEQIYQFQVLAGSNEPRPSTPAKLPPFSAPRYAIWVNSLWFLSLTMSLTAAMLATLQQQWARRYLRVTQPPGSIPHERARMREFFANGVDKLLLPMAVEAVSTLIHISLFLFFAGLLIYLFNINHTVFLAIVWWVGISGAIYVLITFMSIFWLDSPYRSPLSSPVCRASAGILFLAFRILGFFLLCWDTARRWFYDKSDPFREWFLGGRKKPTEMIIRKTSSEIDGRILKWTFNALGGDQEFDQFFQHLLGFCSSKVVSGPQTLILRSLDESELSWALVRFLERTWLSNSVSESDKKRRFVMCVKVVDATYLYDAAWWIHNGTFEGDWYEVRRSVEMGLLLRRRGASGDQRIGLFAQCIVAQIIADVPRATDDWTALATDQLGRDLTHYDNNSVLLANLNHITLQIFTLSSGVNWKMANKMSDCILPSLPRFKVGNALLELQHDFCALWNRIVLDVRTWTDQIREDQTRGDQTREDQIRMDQTKQKQASAIGVLIGIRHIYLDLHQGIGSAPGFNSSTVNTDPKLYEPSSYPLCSISEHHPHGGDLPTGRPAHNVAPLVATDPSLTGTQPTNESSFGGATSQLYEETAAVSPAMVHSPLSPPPLGLHSPVKSPVNQSDRIPHGPASLSSSSIIAPLRVSQQVAPSPDPHLTPIISSAPLSPTILASRHDGGDDRPTITPSAKALGKRPLVEGPDLPSSDQSATREL